jgi:hypothetical protein
MPLCGATKAENNIIFSRQIKIRKPVDFFRSTIDSSIKKSLPAPIDQWKKHHFELKIP